MIQLSRVANDLSNSSRSGTMMSKLKNFLNNNNNHVQPPIPAVTTFL